MHFPNIAAIGCHLLPLIQGARRASASSQCSETPSVSMDWLQGNMGNSVGNSLGNSVETIGLSHQLEFLVEFLFEHFWNISGMCVIEEYEPKPAGASASLLPHTATNRSQEFEECHDFVIVFPIVTLDLPHTLLQAQPAEVASTLESTKKW